VQKRAWWVKGERFRVPATHKRGSNFTLFGAISPCLIDNSYFEVYPSTKGIYFEEFVKNLQQRIRPEFRHKRLIFVADNHKAHGGPRRKALVEQFAELHFIPPYS